MDEAPATTEGEMQMRETMEGDDDFKPETMSEEEVSSEDEDKLGIRNFDCSNSTVLKEKERYNGHFRRAGKCLCKCDGFTPVAIFFFFFGGLACLCHHLASDKDALQNPYT